MKKDRKILPALLFVILLFSLTACAIPPKQMVVVSSPHWKSQQATLQRYAFNAHQQEWEKIGFPMPVYLGKNGLAFQKDIQRRFKQLGPIKQEGDWRTPIGIFPLTTAFAKKARAEETQLNFLHLIPPTRCVDDPQSDYYNQIILDARKVPTIDWKSAEKMYAEPLYPLGLVIDYPTEKSAGSCLFIHLQAVPPRPTAGCLALTSKNLTTLFHWLDKTKRPLLIIGLKKQIPALWQWATH